MRLVRFLAKKSYAVLWIFSVFLFVVYFVTLFLPEVTVDFNIYDTYFVIGSAVFFNLLALWVGLCGLGYFVLLRYNIQPISWLTLLHLAITILLLFPLCFPNMFTVIDNSTAKLNIPITLYKLSANNVKGMAIIMLLTSQLLYFINIIISIAVNMYSGKR